jgi:hypothetical protein
MGAGGFCLVEQAVKDKPARESAKMNCRINGSHLLLHCEVKVVFHCDLGPVLCFTQVVQQLGNPAQGYNNSIVCQSFIGFLQVLYRICRMLAYP